MHRGSRSVIHTPQETCDFGLLSEFIQRKFSQFYLFKMPIKVEHVRMPTSDSSKEDGFFKPHHYFNLQYCPEAITHEKGKKTSITPSSFF